MSEWCWFVAGFWIGCILLWNSCQVHLEKDMPAFFGKEKDGADSEGECVLFKGKDRHDTDGSLSLGLVEASGRVDVAVSVGVLLSSEKVCRSAVSLSPSLPLALASRKRFFCQGWMGARQYTGSRGTLWWESCWIARWMYVSLTVGRRWILRIPWLVLVSRTLTIFAAVDDSEVVHNGIGNHQLTSLVSGRAWRVDKKEFGLLRIVA